MPIEIIAPVTRRPNPPRPRLSLAAVASIAVLGGFWLVLIDRLRLAWETNSQYSYGWFVPFLAAYLFWVRWPSQPEPRPVAPQWPPMILTGLLAGGFWVTRLIHESNPEWTAVSWLLAIQVVGLTLLAIVLASGWASARHFAFPVCFFFVAVAWPLRLEMPLTQNLMQMLAKLAAELLSWSGVPALSKGNLIQLDAGVVGVDEACSGVRSLQSMLMASLFLGELQRYHWFGRLALVALGLGLALFFNILRILILVVVVLRSGLAGLSSWHDPAGYSIFVISFAALCLLVWLFSRNTAFQTVGTADTSPATPDGLRLEAHGPHRQDADVPSSWRPLPRPMFVALGLWLLFTEASTETWYRLHETSPAPQSAWKVLWPEKLPSFVDRPITPQVSKLLAYSEGREGSWQEDDGSRWLMFAFRWNPGRTSSMSARQHRPEICLPGGGQKLVAELAPTVIQVGDLQVPFRTYHFERRGQPLFVFFCLWENGNRDLAGSGVPQEISRTSFLTRVRLGQRNLGQQSAEVVIAGLTSSAGAVEAFQRKASLLLIRGW